jgi:hypothetical protein
MYFFATSFFCFFATSLLLLRVSEGIRWLERERVGKGDML